MPTITNSQSGDLLEVPDYIADLAQLLIDTETHDDPLVRTARKLVVQAALVLQQTNRPEAEPAPVKASPATTAKTVNGKPRQRAPSAAKQLMQEHGLTTAQVKTWATEQGQTVRAQGLPSTELVQAYLDAHQSDAA